MNDQSFIRGRIGYVSGRLHRILRGKLAQKIEEEGLPINPTHFPVVGSLTFCGKAITQGEIVELTGIDKHRISRLVDELLNLGLVEKSINPDNKRQNLVQITSKGQGVMNRVKEVMLAMEKEYTQDIPQEEVDVALKVINSIINKLENE